MLDETEYVLTKFRNANQFEELMVLCAKDLYGGMKFTRLGRNGQRQDGLDLISENGKMVIQCKNYQDGERGRKEFINNARKDYLRVKKSHKDIKKFIAATTLSRDAQIQEQLSDLLHKPAKEKGPSFSILFWEDITPVIIKNASILKRFFPNVVIKPDIVPHTDNKLYYQAFLETLFLHKGKKEKGDKVCLYNLFILQHYKENSDKKVFKDLKRRIKTFIACDDRMLIIEGNAGCGKSSLVSWIGYKYHVGDKEYKSVFRNRQLIIIRLRELDKELIKKNNSLVPVILAYMNLSDVEELSSAFPDGLFVLDGFDELCMIEKISDPAWLIEDFNKRIPNEIKTIITTRPEYIKEKPFERSSRIFLQHFDEDQRKDWLYYYTSPEYCGQFVEPEVIRYIEHIDDWTTAAVCDSPMTLYMLVARDVSKEMLLNCWQLYHQIFYIDISDAEYNEIFTNKYHGYSHETAAYKDILYRISEEIAFAMFRSQNSKFFLTREEVDEIIEQINNDNRLSIPAETRRLLQKCYALNTFWKERSNDGAIEFYHNNIRDFFLCEKILREINRVYGELYMRKITRSDAINKLTDLFYKMFHYDLINSIVNTFIMYREILNAEQKTEFAFIEKQERLLPDLFERVMGISSEAEEGWINTLGSIADVYRYAYQTIMGPGELIKWWNDVEKANQSEIIQNHFQSIFLNTPVMDENNDPVTVAGNGDFSGISLCAKNLRNIGFYYSSLRRANLKRSIFEGSSLENTDLRDADMREADIHFSSLENACLEDADLRSAKLRGTELPDGFCSDNEQEQREHLLGLNIKGLKI